MTRRGALASLLALAGCGPLGDAQASGRMAPAVVAFVASDAGAGSTRDAGDDDLVELDAPPVRWSGKMRRYLPDDGGASRVARPYWFESPVYAAADERRRIRGMIRRNTVLPVAARVSGGGCDRGWYRLVGGGFVCRDDGYAISTSLDPLPDEIANGRPGHESPLPFIYAKARRGDPPIYFRLPSRAELESGSSAPIRTHSTGAHFVAIEALVEHDGARFVRTVRGFFMRVEDVRFLPPSRMSGAMLGDDSVLPVAFVHEQFAPVHDRESLAVIGLAEKYARVGVDEIVRDRGAALVRTDEGHLLPRASVRIARRTPRPDKIPPDAQWLAIDLEEQTLVAYEGDEPVMATLVSSGKAGYEPPLGVFQIEKKYLTKTMSGPDDVAGTYEVEEVPWTTYYWGSLAVHGAYWHDGFGKPRSHGCTNVPPADARWLFYWSEPALPTGWHGAVRLAGPYVYVLRSDEPGASVEE